jgi:hypothetical protein
MASTGIDDRMGITCRGGAVLIAMLLVAVSACSPSATSKIFEGDAAKVTRAKREYDAVYLEMRDGVTEEKAREALSEDMSVVSYVASATVTHAMTWPDRSEQDILALLKMMDNGKTGLQDWKLPSMPPDLREIGEKYLRVRTACLDAAFALLERMRIEGRSRWER